LIGIQPDSSIEVRRSRGVLQEWSQKVRGIDDLISAVALYGHDCRGPQIIVEHTDVLDNLSDARDSCFEFGRFEEQDEVWF